MRRKKVREGRGMDLEFLTEYFAPVIAGICLCVGYVVKKWVKDVDNKFIPTICAALGMCLAMWMHREVAPAVLLQGAFSGLAATGLHQMFSQMIEAKPGKEELSP